MSVKSILVALFAALGLTAGSSGFAAESGPAKDVKDWNVAGGEKDEAMLLTPDKERGIAVYEVCSACHLLEGWGLVDEDRQRVADALAYFSEADDLIPDDIPGLGFLDDAIMIEIVSEELKHEMQAYRDFVVFRAAEQARLGEQADTVERTDWLETRRQQLHSRMRRRRRGGKRGRGGSSFSLF